MKYIFVSNYFNHHQKPFSDEMFKLCNGEYHFISTTQMRQERRELGYGVEDIPSYVCCSYTDEDSESYCKAEINRAQVVIIGSADEKFIRSRIKRGKLVIRCSERIMKNGFKPLKFIPRIPVWHLRNPKRKPIYLLCASAFAAADYNKMGLFRNRTYKWGYFPQMMEYDIDKLIETKNKMKLLWCGRFIGWKHPDDVLFITKLLKASGYNISLDLIGTGEMTELLKRIITENKLEGTVNILGPMSPEQVRKHMEEANIYLFTSDFNEGWGAVLNEAMNSGCAVVASHAIGSVPFMIKNGNNGIIYKSNDRNDLYAKVKYLLDHSDVCAALGKNAYRTITELWNAKTAAERFKMLTEELDKHGTCDLFNEGPCSRADIIANDWWS